MKTLEDAKTFVEQVLLKVGELKHEFNAFGYEISTVQEGQVEYKGVKKDIRHVNYQCLHALEDAERVLEIAKKKLVLYEKEIDYMNKRF